MAAVVSGREKLRRQNMQKMLGRETMRGYTENPEFATIRDRLFYGQILPNIHLKSERCSMVVIAALVAEQAPRSLLREHLQKALSTDLNPEEISEIIYQCTPYVGLARVESALETYNEVLTERYLNYPKSHQGSTSEDNRFERGKQVQEEIFGKAAIQSLHDNCPSDTKLINIELLSSYCFGDFYTRLGLSLSDRELITFACLACLSGCEPQLRAHVHGNVNMLNKRQALIEVIALLVPFIGFPRSLNALRVVLEETKIEESEN